MKEFGSEKIIFDKMTDNFSLIRCLYMHRWWVPSWAAQLLMEQFDTLPIQCRHIEHMHEGVLKEFCSEIFFLTK